MLLLLLLMMMMMVVVMMNRRRRQQQLQIQAGKSKNKLFHSFNYPHPTNMYYLLTYLLHGAESFLRS